MIAYTYSERSETMCILDMKSEVVYYWKFAKTELKLALMKTEIVM